MMLIMPDMQYALHLKSNPHLPAMGRSILIAGSMGRDLRFASLIDKLRDGDHTWYFCLVVINPSAPDSKLVKNKHLQPRIAKFKELALKFYVSGFATNSTTTSSIRLAVENEITIIIVTKKKTGFIHTCKSM